VATSNFADNAKTASVNVNNFATAAAAATQSLSNIQAVSGVLTESANEAANLKERLSDLNKNLTALNTVYGNILSAMRPQ
jgi:hypothetical protein